MTRRLRRLWRRLPHVEWVDLGSAGGKVWIAEVVSPTSANLSKRPPGSMLVSRRPRSITTATGVWRPPLQDPDGGRRGD